MLDTTENTMNTETIKIEYGITKNTYERVGGFLPMLIVNGRKRGNTYSGVAYEADYALALAKAEAQEEASRYIGDWNVTVTEAA